MNLVKYLAEAAFFLELAVAYEERRPLRANLLKNLGTAYMHIVRSPNPRNLNPRDHDVLFTLPLVQMKTDRRPFTYEEKKLSQRGSWYENPLSSSSSCQTSSSIWKNYLSHLEISGSALLASAPKSPDSYPLMTLASGKFGHVDLYRYRCRYRYFQI